MHVTRLCASSGWKKATRASARPAFALLLQKFSIINDRCSVYIKKLALEVYCFSVTPSLPFFSYHFSARILSLVLVQQRTSWDPHLQRLGARQRPPCCAACLANAIGNPFPFYKAGYCHLEAALVPFIQRRYQRNCQAVAPVAPGQYLRKRRA